jgi:hypothetical protein
MLGRAGDDFREVVNCIRKAKASELDRTHPCCTGVGPPGSSVRASHFHVAPRTAGRRNMTPMATTEGPRMEREAAIRLLRALVAVGLRQRESMANAAIRSIAFQAGLDEFDAAQQYAQQQGWLVEAGRGLNRRTSTARPT